MNKKENSKQLEKQYYKTGNVKAMKKPLNFNSNNGGVNLRKALDEEKDFTAKKLPQNFHSEMQKARMAKNLTQKELAHKLCVKETQVKFYECGKAYPDNNFIQKIEKVLNCKLPRPKKK